MKISAALLISCLFLSACLSPGDARSLGYEQGIEGEGYNRILGKSADEHRAGWVEGNTQYCRNLSYSALARSTAPLPSGICTMSDANIRAYCNAVDYAAFGRADQDIPHACVPSSSQQRTYAAARGATYCTFDQARGDLRSAVSNLWSYGSCTPGSSRRSCERSSTLYTSARNYCTADGSYLAGTQSLITSAVAQAVSETSDELADLSSIQDPLPEQAQRREELQDYLEWAPDCRLREFRMDC